MRFFSLFYPLILLVFIFLFLRFIFHIFTYNTNLKLLKKLDLLFLEKQDYDQQIIDLQEELSVLLLKVQQPTSSEVAFELLSNNSSLFVGLVFFLFSFLLLNYSVKFDPQFLFHNILKSQKTQKKFYEYSIAKIYEIVCTRLSKDVGKVLVDDSSVSLEHFSNELFLAFAKLAENDQKSLISICEKIEDLCFKSQTIDAQIVQILEILSR